MCVRTVQFSSLSEFNGNCSHSAESPWRHVYKSIPKLHVGLWRVYRPTLPRPIVPGLGSRRVLQGYKRVRLLRCPSCPDSHNVAAVTTTMSVLSALTTGPWSRFGDAHGRKPILSLTIGGAIAM